jgi:hypothetical protein
MSMLARTSHALKTRGILRRTLAEADIDVSFGAKRCFKTFRLCHKTNKQAYSYRCQFAIKIARSVTPSKMESFNRVEKTPEHPDFTDVIHQSARH